MLLDDDIIELHDFAAFSFTTARYATRHIAGGFLVLDHVDKVCRCISVPMAYGEQKRGDGWIGGQEGQRDPGMERKREKGERLHSSNSFPSSSSIVNLPFYSPPRPLSFPFPMLFLQSAKRSSGEKGFQIYT